MENWNIPKERIKEQYRRNLKSLRFLQRKAEKAGRANGFTLEQLNELVSKFELLSR